MKKRQIFVSGPSGSGKSTLASHISTKYGITHVRGSSKELWPEFGIKNHRDIIEMTNLSPERGLEFQQKLLLHRETKLRGLPEFVMDRGPLDSMVYFMLQNSPYLTTKQTQHFIEMCNKQFHLYDSIQIYLKPHADKLVDDGKRINNAYYQNMTHLMYLEAMESLAHKKRIFIIEEWKWEDRTKRVKEILNPGKPNIWDEIKERLGL